jgi:branched-chain amino acid transport system ATP-binding protein
VSNPNVLLLDEPTEGLAPVVVQAVPGLILTLRSSGVAILLAEQNHRIALRVADRVALMEKGAVVEDLPVEAARESDALHRVLGL